MRKSISNIKYQVSNSLANSFFVLAQGVPDWSDTKGQQPARFKDLEVVFGRIVSVAAQLAGIGFFVMLVFGGFKYLTSKGDQQKTAEARQTLTYAIIGLVVIVSGWLILKILGDVLGLNLLEFRIPTEF